MNPEMVTHQLLTSIKIAVKKKSFRIGASLALVGHPSSDGVTMKIPYEGKCSTATTSLASHLLLLGWSN